MRIAVKLLCQADAGRTLFTLGLKSETHGNWAFHIGACPTRGISFSTNGWHLLVNAASPLAEKVPLAGFDNRDWHTFVLLIPGAEGPARLVAEIDLNRRGAQWSMLFKVPAEEGQERALHAELACDAATVHHLAQALAKQLSQGVLHMASALRAESRARGEATEVVLANAPTQLGTESRGTGRTSRRVVNTTISVAPTICFANAGPRATNACSAKRPSGMPSTWKPASRIASRRSTLSRVTQAP